MASPPTPGSCCELGGDDPERYRPDGTAAGWRAALAMRPPRGQAVRRDQRGDDFRPPEGTGVTSEGSPVIARCAARIRLGTRVHNGLTVVEIERPDPGVVRRGFGRVWLQFQDDDGQPAGGTAYYPSTRIMLYPGDDTPPDPTMDDWAGRWWPIEDVERPRP